MKILPAWMWRDPAEVAERIENGAIAAARRQLCGERTDLCVLRTDPKPRTEYGLVGAATVRLIKRARIRELLAQALKGTHGKI
jgi:hypothetical protein